ncbi:MAG: hypothetical protein ACI9D5_002100 [Candidatus Endobugula sp.]|jgi:hypothetical protein
MAANIASVVPILDNLSATLDRAYWEVNSINAKDAIYDCTNAINKELSEINKLSIQDHDLLYEPISHEFKAMCGRLPLFRKHLDRYIMRITTLEILDNAISSTIQMMSPDPAHLKNDK